MQATKYLVRRIVAGVIGGVVLIVGLVAIPYPGPGWLIVFTGLAILATEFDWAQRVLDRCKALYDHWMEWLMRQPLSIRLLAASGTVCVVVATLYLCNGFGLVADLLGLDVPWVHSPFVS